MAFLRRHPTPETRRDASGEGATIERRQAPVEPPTVKPLHVGRYGGEVRPEAPKPLPKLARRQKVRQDIRDSARGEDCTVRIPGVCNFDPQTTVWSHYPLNDASKGMATKSLDVAGCYCCSACHDVVDARVKPPAGMTRADAVFFWFQGHMRSLVRLAEKGLL